MDGEGMSRNGSLGGQSSLYRPTPIPTDLMSTSSSLGRSHSQRNVTPTIREDEDGAADEPCAPFLAHFCKSHTCHMDSHVMCWPQGRAGQQRALLRRSAVFPATQCQPQCGPDAGGGGGGRRGGQGQD